MGILLIRALGSFGSLSAGQVQRQLEKLEAGGILISQFSGNTKNFCINPRLGIKAELTVLLERMLTLLPESEIQRYCLERRRRGSPASISKIPRTPSGLPPTRPQMGRATSSRASGRTPSATSSRVQGANTDLWSELIVHQVSTKISDIWRLQQIIISSS